jgi:AcrR family transcriptional regulator
MGPSERRAREREELRSLILEAARELFAAQGYEAVTMREIAKRIEYSPTAIYFHFKDKESLLRDLCDADFGQLAHQLVETARIADPIEKLRATGAAYFRFGVEHPNHYRLMFMTPHPPLHSEESALRRGNPEEDAYQFLKDIVAQAIRENRFRPELTDVELVAQTIWAGVHGVISLQIAKCNDDWVEWRDLEARAQTMIDILIKGLSHGR